jgi:putative transposase
LASEPGLWGESQDKGFCLDAVRQALQISKPKIFNTDQGSQFTSTDFTGLLEKQDIKVSMDGRGRVFDNIFIERLWRSVKYEEVYLRDDRGGSCASCGLHSFLQ